MERIANDAIKSFDKKGPSADEQLHYPWPDHDISKGEIAEEFAALKRAVQDRRCATAAATRRQPNQPTASNTKRRQNDVLSVLFWLVPGRPERSY